MLVVLSGMAVPHRKASSEFVSRQGFGSLLAAVTAEAHDPQAGIFGPDSATRRVNRESALFLGAGRAALLQLAHPWVATALAQHSNLLARPIARFHNTFRIVFTMIFGTVDQARAAARHLYALHTVIRGELTEDTAGWACCSHYEANEINALRWVYSTLVESAVIAWECALGPMTAAFREEYYAESRTLAGLFGLPPAALPADWKAFLEYNRGMHESTELGVSREARFISASLLSGAGSWIRPPHWYRALTIAWLPPRFRDEFALPFGNTEQASAARAARRFPTVYRLLPPTLRFTGPWQEAQARLEHRRPGALTRLSNQFWIGVPLLPFASQTCPAHPTPLQPGL
jgi:uncharacterized protein (DUF2236 family)